MDLEKTIKKIKRKIAAPLVTGTLALGSLMPAYANEEVDSNISEETEQVSDKPKGKIFEGNIVSSNIDSLFTYNHQNDGRVHLEVISDPWTDETNPEDVAINSYSLGLRTPSIDGRLRFSGTVDTNHDFEGNYSIGVTEMV